MWSQDINKYLIGRLMFRIQNNELPIFQNSFTRNRAVHFHDTRQKIISTSHHLKLN